MKKLALTIAVVLGLSMTSFAGQNDGGLFKRGATAEKANNRDGGLTMPGLPDHGSEDNESAPLGTGIAVLAGLGAAYLIGKKRNQE